MASHNNHQDLAFTGERVVPGKTPRPLLMEHLLRYRFAAKFVSPGTSVLDIGCGTGYGSAILAEKARWVVGLDRSGDAIHFAQRNYPRPNLHFCCADCRALPFHDGSFDRAILFEVIEHILEHNNCLNEIRRILTSRGMLILSTPNPASPTKAIEEPNPFHKKELQEHELLELLRPYFRHVELLFQHELSAWSIETVAGRSGRSNELADDFSRDSPPKYFVAVCSSRPTRIRTSRMLGLCGIQHQIGIVQDLRHKEKEVMAHRREIEALLAWREEKERDCAKHLAAHQEDIGRLREEISELQRERSIREQGLTEFDVQKASLEVEKASLRMELDWLYRWLPINRLAHRLLYGRNLRRRILRKLGINS